MITGFRHLAAVTVIGAVLGAGAFTLPAYAQQGRISWSQLTKRLEDKGFRIRELDIKREGWKAEVIDREGRKLKLRLNRQGDIVREKVDY